MRAIELSSDDLVSRLLGLSSREPVFILDSCGVGHLGSHLLIAGVRPVEVLEVSNDDTDETLKLLDAKLSSDLAAIFSLSYDFGIKLQPNANSIGSRKNEKEPDVFLAQFPALIIHDYDSRRTLVAGSDDAARNVEALLERSFVPEWLEDANARSSRAKSNFTRTEYTAAVDLIREYIRRGDTYQTNPTQQVTCDVAPDLRAESIYARLRLHHPAPFAAFLRRPGSTVISASPERFFRVDRQRKIESSPIKGTRPRGREPDEDRRLREELMSSEKDRAENTMIVDLVRNDLGRVCEFGSVVVEKLCDIEEHPTLFHLVSTVRGSLRNDTTFSDILRAVFPCGSITGAPKIRTMEIIDEIEKTSRGLSMGAIGMYLPLSWEFGEIAIDTVFDLSVAIRTAVVRDGKAVFNVGGGIVIDSDPLTEYDESLLKARALLAAFGAEMREPS